jgi:hypothetical protein
MARTEKPDARKIAEITERYETWLRQQTTVVEDDLCEKHEAMCDSPFPFLRATY